ncbi:mitotic spindle assembly checkpoint protein-like protein MAD1 [Lophiostoma macrostomum CBS 122681]|uniref:Spindle assembly checkpoint component MAD1 n=1 Tax=Lophiostoma macrostomum CBS 122681 TaxID=1314788 RepID=A0A6A6T8N3_9PLEO|nr:mitotic spindle assembly checkpoint protein-like protein MAD1 [Lophiostoma macrostomum CBS 122681]
MAASRKQNQPSFNIFTGAEDSPPLAKREPLRETFRTTLRTSQNAPSHTVLPADPVNEDLRAQINTLKYELETANQEQEMLKLEHQQEIRDLQSKAEADFKKAQQAETANNLTLKKYDSLQKEFSEAQTRSANERHDLEKRLRTSQEKAQQLQEDSDELREDLANSQRQNEHKLNSLKSEHKTVKDSVDNLRSDVEVKVNALQAAQRKLSQKEAEVGDLESEVLRLKAITGDAETLAVIKRELSEQVAHIKKLETLTREQNAELRQYRKQHKAIEVVEEEKRDLQNKVRMMDDLRRELSEAQLRKQVLEDERDSWTSYLEEEAESQDGVQFRSPEDLARAFIRERLEKTDLMNRLGEIKPELSVKEANIQTLEDEKVKLRSEIDQLKAAGTTISNPNEAKARARLERQKALATKEVDFLRAQVKAFDDEEREMQPEAFDTAKTERVRELETLVDDYRKEIETLNKEWNAVDKPVSVAAGQKRLLDTEDADERVGELRRKNRQLQDEHIEFQKRIKLLESEYKAQSSQLRKLKDSSRVRVLELKSNPTADAEALKLSTVRILREANAELLARLEGAQPSSTSVPLATLTAAQDELAELTHTVAEKEKRIKRLKQIWAAKSLEFREAVASILGWKLDFMPNGRVRVTSMFYPGDEQTGENSIVFDGENGTMKVSGGEHSAFANEIRDLITFWVEERKEIPCFLAAMTLEFWERTTRAAR